MVAMVSFAHQNNEVGDLLESDKCDLDAKLEFTPCLHQCVPLRHSYRERIACIRCGSRSCQSTPHFPYERLVHLPNSPAAGGLPARPVLPPPHRHVSHVRNNQANEGQDVINEM
jgi:hypothetical protein